MPQSIGVAIWAEPPVRIIGLSTLVCLLNTFVTSSIHRSPHSILQQRKINLVRYIWEYPDWLFLMNKVYHGMGE